MSAFKQVAVHPTGASVLLITLRILYMDMWLMSMMLNKLLVFVTND
jgi:hypothetical protein